MMRLLLSPLLLASNILVSAFWRMSCSNIQVGRIDPIVSPGSIASHVHTISGASSFGLSSTYDDLVGASCTSCSVQDDKSAYWTPKLYYSHADGTFEEVPNSGMAVYYLGRGENRSNIQPFPPGFKMISGNNFARSYNDKNFTFGGTEGVTLVNGSCDGNGACSSTGTFVNGRAGVTTFFGRPISDAVSYACLGGSTGKETPGFQDMNCPNGFRAQIHFQSCWDGVNLYKTDNSHVAFMSQIDNGICPPTHSVLLPHLFFEVMYGVNEIQKKDGFFVFANGDKTGYGFHGDFFNGWNMTIQTAAIQECLNTDNNGQISACAPLMLSNSEQASYNCAERQPLVNETVHGTLKALPGCNNIESGTAPASPASHSCPSGMTQPAINPTATTSGPHTTFLPERNKVYGNWTYIGCLKDSNNPRVLVGSSFNSENMTNEVCQDYCAQKGYPLAGLEYGRECFCGLSLAPTTMPVQDCNPMICAGNSSQFCGGPSRLSLWNSTSFVSSRLPIPSKVNDTLKTNSGILRYVGCAKDLQNGQRSLSLATFSSSSMKIESCAMFCAGRGAHLAGLEYARECYCGNKLASGSELGSSTACTMNCVGNVTEICGGPAALSVWDLTNLPV